MTTELSQAVCPIDYRSTTVFLGQDQLHFCPSCRHGWADGAETPAQYEQEYFTSIYTRPAAYGAWLNRRYRDILRVCRRLESSLRCSLDVGCGQGELVQFLAVQGMDAEGIETSERYASDCRARGLNVHTGLSCDLEPRTKRYDLVSVLHVLEHLNEPMQVVQNLRTLTRPGGLIYVELPNELEAWRSRVKRLLGRPASPPALRLRAGHRQCFTSHSIRRLMQQAGCQVLRVDTRDVIEPHACLWKRLAIDGANLLATATLLQGNIIRCWSRVV